jgi:N-formylmaleamate deformylase
MDMESADPFDAFKAIDIPILLFTGSKEAMCIVSEETAQEAMKANPRVQVVHREGASHDIRRTRFEGYMPALKKFLEEIYQSVAVSQAEY